MPTIRPKSSPTPVSTPAIPKRSDGTPKAAPTQPDSSFKGTTATRNDPNAVTPESMAAFAGRAAAAGPIVGNAKVEKQPIRTYEMKASGGAKEVELRSKGVRDAELPAATKYKPVSEKQLAAAVKSASAVRTKDLKDGKIEAAPRAMPEDGSLRIKNMHMALIGSDQTGATFPMQMARIGEVEGFRVTVRIDDWSLDSMKRLLKEEKLDNVSLLEIKDPVEEDFWSEDQGELHVDGSVSVPRHMKDSGAVSLSEIRTAVLQDRMARLHPRSEQPSAKVESLQKAVENNPDIAFSNIGAVGERNGQRAIAAIAKGSDNPVRVNASYIEGGNLLLGSRGGEPYALVGKDSVAATRLVLEKDLGRKVSTEEALDFIAKDFGTTRAIAVEQAGDFHIDMKMSLLPDGKVLLNDAKAAFKLQKEWLLEDHEKAKPQPPKSTSAQAQETYKEDLQYWKDDGVSLKQQLKTMESHANRDAKMEDLAAKDMEKAGLTVHRVAGVFTSAHGQVMNFLNSERAINPKGESFMIALGGDARAERYFVDKLVNDIPSGLSRIHFLDREASGTTLQAMGGISCRTKLEGEPV